MSIPWSNAESRVAHIATSPYLSVIYLPQVLAIKLDRDMNIWIDDNYRMARKACLLISLMILLIAFEIKRPSLLVWGVLFLPMMLFQFSSTTTDALSVSLSILILNVFTK
jgi:uncharacterized membrane protein